MEQANVEANALIETLQDQRNTALNTVASLKAKLAVSNASLQVALVRIKELEAQVPKDRNPEKAKAE